MPFPPHPCPQSHHLSGLAQHRNKEAAQNARSLLSDGSGHRGSDRRVRPHTLFVSSPLSSSSKSLSLVLSVCSVCLKSSQSKEGGRVQGVGRLVTAAGALGAGECGDFRAGEDKRGSVRRVNNGEGVAEDLNFTPPAGLAPARAPLRRGSCSPVCGPPAQTPDAPSPFGAQRSPTPALPFLPLADPSPPAVCQ